MAYTKRQAFYSPRKWTSAEVEILLQMAKDGAPKWEIAKALDRPAQSVSGKLDDLRLFGRAEESVRFSVKKSTEPDHTNDLLRERDRQMQMDTRDLTARLAGDPLPTRSALFKKTGQTV